MTLRHEMKATLVEEANYAVAAIAEAEGLDMVLDKSCVYISANVKDITEAVVAKLNADAPAAEGGESEATSSESTGDGDTGDN